MHTKDGFLFVVHFFIPELGYFHVGVTLLYLRIVSLYLSLSPGSRSLHGFNLFRFLFLRMTSWSKVHTNETLQSEHI